MSAERYKKPRTIDELRWFCDDHDIPAREMRFFIGEDTIEPKAFGIFKDDDGDFVVYKNKADGSRAIRYKGSNEAYAVNELYEKMKAETEQRRAAHRESPFVRSSDYSEYGRSTPSRSSFFSNKAIILLVAIVLVIVVVAGSVINFFRSFERTPNRGYYAFHGHKYYNDQNDWYYYDESAYEWYPAYDIDPILIENFEDYYLSRGYEDDYGVSDFSDSEYYDYYDDYDDYDDDYYSDDDDYDWDDDDDWDYDYDDWDYDDWDYDDTDWDSDW